MGIAPLNPSYRPHRSSSSLIFVLHLTPFRSQGTNRYRANRRGAGLSNWCAPPRQPALAPRVRIKAGSNPRAVKDDQSKEIQFAVCGSRHMHFRLPLLSLAAALIAADPLPARADAPAAKDVATIGECLAKKRTSQEADEVACLMTVAKPCMGGDEADASDRRAMDCLDRE